MRFFKRIAGFLGFAKDESHELKDDVSNDGNVDDDFVVDTNLPRKGFSVPVQVAVDRAQVGPLIIPCTVGDGGVQGLRWYARRLRIDEEGDVADEFIDEVLTATTSTTVEIHHSPMQKFELKYSTKPAKVRNQTLVRDGKVQQFVEFQGRLQLV